ncbi:uncharacterized protein LOC124279753 [Haliotis rubra]|uniref:uncharacterized protein LOC124279753 n=1 Tax=Haliotis rubra TaxID=36100 RepID=UPI001EE61FE6|nr:uncharacterized protein LOC124279753 [Haliotis rubra]
MKFTIAIILLGALLESVAACSIASCSLTGTLTGTAGCTNYQTYITCLGTQKNSCGTSALDIAAKGIIDTAINSNTLLRTALGCSGASLTTISSMALILSVVVTLMKTHF